MVDATGLNGFYDISFDMTLSEMQGSTASGSAAATAQFNPAEAASEPIGAPTLVNSLRKLGLDLADRKMPVAKLVIQHVERTAVEN